MKPSLDSNNRPILVFEGPQDVDLAENVTTDLSRKERAVLNRGVSGNTLFAFWRGEIGTITIAGEAAEVALKGIVNSAVRDLRSLADPDLASNAKLESVQESLTALAQVAALQQQAMGMEPGVSGGLESYLPADMQQQSQ